MNRIFTLLACTTLFAAFAPVAQCQVFTNRVAFNAAAGTLNFESFEAAFSSAPSVTFGPVTVSETNDSVGTNTIGQERDLNLVPGIPTDGTGAVVYNDNGPSIVVFQFATPINAFALDLASVVTTTATFGGGASGNVALTANTPSFFGFINQGGTFSQVTFEISSTQQGSFTAFDALSYGVSRVPRTRQRRPPRRVRPHRRGLPDAPSQTST